MLKRRKHLYHLVNRSSRAFILSIYAFFFMTGFLFILADLSPLLFKGDFAFISLIIIILNIKKWYSEVITESTFSGHHTIIVQLGLEFGFCLFIVSEIMLFFGFFWAFFHFALSPDIQFGYLWPPLGINIVNPLEVPFFNTLLLLMSGFSLTRCHKAVLFGFVKDAFDSFLITIFLGFLFIFLQMLEYYESSYNFNDSAYSCSFYMLTGLHGMHVFAGVNFILVCFFRYQKRHFYINHHLGFTFAAWYWHFVDIVWIILFLIVYLWGSGLGLYNLDIYYI